MRLRVLAQKYAALDPSRQSRAVVDSLREVVKHHRGHRGAGLGWTRVRQREGCDQLLRLRIHAAQPDSERCDARFEILKAGPTETVLSWIR